MVKDGNRDFKSITETLIDEKSKNRDIELLKIISDNSLIIFFI